MDCIKCAAHFQEINIYNKLQKIICVCDISEYFDIYTNKCQNCHRTCLQCEGPRED